MVSSLSDLTPDFSFEKNGEAKSSSPRAKKAPETPEKIRGLLGVISDHSYSPTKGKQPKVTAAINELAFSLDNLHEDPKSNEEVNEHVKQRAYKAVRNSLTLKASRSASAPYSPLSRSTLARNHQLLTQDEDYKKIAKHLNRFPDDCKVIAINVDHITKPEVREFSSSPIPPKISGGHERPSDDFKTLLTTSTGVGLGILSLPLPSSQSSSTSGSFPVKYVKGHKTYFPFDDVDHISRIATSMSPPLGVKNDLSVHVYTDPKGKEWLIGACHKHGSLHTAYPIIVINAADVGFEDYSVKNDKGEVLTVGQAVLQEAAKKSAVLVTITYKGKEYDLIDIAEFLARNGRSLDPELFKTIPRDILSIPKNLLAAVPGKAAQRLEHKRAKDEAGKAYGAAIRAAALANKDECEEESEYEDDADPGIADLFIS